MTEEEEIVAELAAKFPMLKNKIQRRRSIYVETPADKFAEVFAHLFGPMRFTMLTAITGLDSGANLEVMYHLARLSGIVLNLSVAVPKTRPVLYTVTGYFPAADCYERELVDMLGMVIEGLPEGFRYPLPDGWPEGQYPLRKDWKPEMLEPATVLAPAPAGAAPAASPVPNPPPAKETKHVG